MEEDDDEMEGEGMSEEEDDDDPMESGESGDEDDYSDSNSDEDDHNIHPARPTPLPGSTSLISDTCPTCTFQPPPPPHQLHLKKIRVGHLRMHRQECYGICPPYS